VQKHEIRPAIFPELCLEPKNAEQNTETILVAAAADLGQLILYVDIQNFIPDDGK
jgi:hypothetical protein